MSILNALLILFLLMCQVQSVVVEHEQEALLAPFMRALEEESGHEKPPEVIPPFPNLFGDPQWLYPDDRNQF